MTTTRKSTIFLFFGLIIGLFFGLFIKNYRALEIVKRCNLKPSSNGNESPLDLINLRLDETVLNSQRNLLFVGVMTAKNFLKGRAKAVYDTWGKEVPGRIAFFSSEDSYASGLPVVSLPGVDDRYPPQKKSFMMLYYMYEHYIDRFEWFARADDDVYVNTVKLEKFLRSIDSSKPQFIGQAGKGNTEEFGLLSLEFDENFCMGGPGVILSRETLRRVAPHIPTCLKNLYSTHEDVEIGRCVQKFAGIPCTWNYEMQSILHHNSSGRYAFTGTLKSKEIHSAITLHPVKKAPLMYRLHTYMQGLKAQEIRQQSLQLHRDIARMKTLLQLTETNRMLVPGVPIFPLGPENPQYLGNHDILGKNPDLNKYRPQSVDQLLNWNFMGRSMYSMEHSNPKRKAESSFREGLEDVVTEIMENINNFSRQRGRVIEFREMLYGYSRINPLYGHDLIMDLLLIYKKYRGKKMTVPVRRHLYIQRAFTDIFVREMNQIDGDLKSNLSETDRLSQLSAKVKDLWFTGFGKISETLIANNPKEVVSQPTIAVLPTPVNSQESTIVFVLSLSGRYDTFIRFLRNYETVCLKRPNQNIELLVIFFGESTELQSYYDELIRLRDQYPNDRINEMTLSGSFSRGIALDTATRSTYISDDNIIFFIDVDIIFDRTSIERIRLNTVQHQQVYLPIVFSEYDPKLMPDDLRSGSNFTTDHNSWNYSRGYFRQFGYGICAIYKSDIMHPNINGFNTDINGWGLEDVRFLEKIVELNHKTYTRLYNTADTVDDKQSERNDPNQMVNPPPLRLNIFRAVDPTLIHVYHDIHCDKNLDDAQYGMCLGTKANTLGSYRQIEQTFLRNSKIVEFTRNLHAT